MPDSLIQSNITVGAAGGNVAGENAAGVGENAGVGNNYAAGSTTDTDKAVDATGSMAADNSEINKKLGFELPFLPAAVETAEHLLRELNWGEHFVGISMNPAMGNNNVYCYSLNEALRFLTQGSSRLGILKGSSRGGMSWVDTPAYLLWLRNCVGDVELADYTERALAELNTKHEGNAKGAPYLEQTNVLSEALGMRVLQLKAVIEQAEAEAKAAEEAANGGADAEAAPAADGTASADAGGANGDAKASEPTPEGANA